MKITRALISVSDKKGIAEFARGISKQEVTKLVLHLEIEIHRQKCEIIRDVDEAESIVELDTIEDGCRFRREMDVIEAQIAMAIANPPLLNALFE